MTLANFFLVCFVVGFALSLIAFMFGALNLHLPHYLGGHGFTDTVGHLPGHGPVHGGGLHGAGQAMARGAGGTSAPAGGEGLATQGNASGVSAVNFMTLTAFLAWFGGVGFLMTRYYAVAAVVAVAGAVAGGIAGASVVFLFLAKVLLPHETQLDPADYEMAGTLATVTGTLRPEGTGEIQFSQGGTRRSAPARSEDGRAIDKGAEVIVSRYERGIAYVNLFDEMVK
jgi:hypothetical protein